MKNNIPTKNKLNPLKANFNAFFMELFELVGSRIIIIHYRNENCNILKLNLLSFQYILHLTEIAYGV